jgi:DNA-binding GntR family transcriptional regulator
LPSTAKQHCLSDLRMRIMTLDIAPGSDLDEARLTAEYGISRTPLREVLQRLAGAGLITTQDNRGAKVASMDLAVLRTFFQTAPMIYANIARLAAENGTPAQLGALKDVQQRFAKAEASDAAMLNHRFHELIGEMAHNPYLMAALTRMLVDHARLSQTFYRPASSEEAALVGLARDQHDAMIDALAAGDGALMVDLTLQHWDLSKDRMERFVRPDPLPLDMKSLKDDAYAV